MTTPTARPARFPADYGQGREPSGDLSGWDEVAARIARSPNYWLAATSDAGRPHLRPVDGVFVGDTLAFGGSPATRWVRFVLERPEISVSLPDDDHAVILEGRAQIVTDPNHVLADPVREANVDKYPQYYATDDTPEFRPFWALRPDRVFAWSLSTFPDRATRFDFDAA